MNHNVSGHLSLEMIEKEISYWERLKRVWLRCDTLPEDDLQTFVCKTHIRESNVSKVVAAVRETGIAPVGFDTNTVSSIIREGSISDKELQSVAKSVLESNKKQASRFA